MTTDQGKRAVDLLEEFVSLHIAQFGITTGCNCTGCRALHYLVEVGVIPLPMLDDSDEDANNAAIEAYGHPLERATDNE